MTKSKKILKRILMIALALALISGTVVLSVDSYVRFSASGQILSPEDAAKLSDVDCILVLGCLVKNNGEPSHMLEDRLKMGVSLYNAKAAPKLLMSGDHGQKEYDEVSAMKTYAVNAGIPSSDVFMDHAGFSTYESIYRAKDIFQAKKIIIVTQEYHLYRALYIANALGLEAYGVCADYRTYSGQTMRDIREVVARVKDVVFTVLKVEPTYRGDAIPIFGDGNLTNDETWKPA